MARLPQTREHFLCLGEARALRLGALAASATATECKPKRPGTPHEQLEAAGERVTEALLATKRKARALNERMIHRTMLPVDPHVLRDLHRHEETGEGTAGFA